MLVMVVFFIAFRWIHLSTPLIRLFLLVLILLFFFSSRRRHTRFSLDWSSDVCSSDLACPWRSSSSPGGPRIGRLGQGRSGGARSVVPVAGGRRPALCPSGAGRCSRKCRFGWPAAERGHRRTT